MGSTRAPEPSETSHDPEHSFTCPECGQPVVAVAKRHKTLGAYVPVWKPGPCRNPDCPLHVPPEAGGAPSGNRDGPAGR
ncbi:hypothetical protein AB0903_05340 [Streptomyces sp. NPDC048389]|uniref:hypothetical protein n=1 Tax=Streptomyces sp. NPDC048389 TaxID=3154622 RepID=UPI003451C8DF